MHLRQQVIALKVSIHAPVMDANYMLIRDAQKMLVSIHAPVMDAKWSLDVWVEIGSFNPRARDGREGQ